MKVDNPRRTAVKNQKRSRANASGKPATAKAKSGSGKNAHKQAWHSVALAAMAGWLKPLRQHRLLTLVGSAVVVLAIGFALWPAVSSAVKQAGDSSKTRAAENELRSQVDTSTGAPQNGRDPASQPQNSLAAAASSPNGTGQRTDKPAAGVTGDHSHHAQPGDVYGDPKQTGIASNGCYIDYGAPGEQCLPAHAAGEDKKLTCDEVRKFFKDGIKVSGTDRFHLDHNGDKLACGAGE